MMTFNIPTSRPVKQELIGGQGEKVARDVQNARESILDLENQVDRLSLITQALWELLRAQAGLKDDDLVRLIEEIDLRDGVKDGKRRAQPDLCPDCQRPISIRTNMCLFCGKRYPRKTPF